MKKILISIFAFLTVSTAFALDKVITIEGPVSIVGSTPTETTYFIETPERIQYKVMVPRTESEKFALMLKESPAAVVRFDGTVVNNEGSQVFKVQKWQRVTTTTTTTDSDGITSQRKTTVLEKR